MRKIAVFIEKTGIHCNEKGYFLIENGHCFGKKDIFTEKKTLSSENRTFSSVRVLELGGGLRSLTLFRKQSTF